MSIFDVRVADQRALNRMIVGCQLTDVTTGHDDRGFFVASCKAPDWFMALPSQAEVEANKPETPVVAPRKAPAGRKAEGGPCGEIRAWARANPNATKDEAIANFPGFNRATVSIQFRKVRLGQV